MTTSKYEKGDSVKVRFEQGELLIVTLGDKRKTVDWKGRFIGWSYNSKTNGINYIMEEWIEGFYYENCCCDTPLICSIHCKAIELSS